MFKINEENGDIIFPDGFVLSCPYEDARYQEYATWVQNGNVLEAL